MATLAKENDPIVIIGAGVFGLSTALHLAQRGFKDITVLDKQPYHESEYSFDKGCDAASADINKIIRAAYGPEVVYQDLAFEAMHGWEKWNEYLSHGYDIPPGMTQGDQIWVNNGNLQVCGQMELPRFEKASLENMKRAGKGHTQVVVTSQQDIGRAQKNGFGFAVDPFNRVKRGKAYQALLDTSGGFVYADKACRLALHLARHAGVKCILGSPAGEYSAFVEDIRGKVIGVKSVDGKIHPANLAIAACGGWTQQVIPDLDGLCETTGGSVCFIQIPPSSHLFDRFAPENFPTWTYKMRDGVDGGLYGFPRGPTGVMKVGYRGTKYTNPNPLSSRSLPITKWTRPESIERFPAEALRRVRNFLDEYLPELGEEGINISQTRLCWYNDSFDNHFVIDAVPGRHGLMVATGGSGHAFMFFPSIGKYVADRVQGKKTAALEFWRWRRLNPENKPVNVLMEGVDGKRVLGKQRLYNDDELELGRREWTEAKL